MISFRPQIINLLKQISFVFALYTICRLLFFIFNYSQFNDITTSELLKLFVFGLRFDSFSIAATNALYILLCMLPFKFYYNKVYSKAISVIFIITNSLAFGLNFIDFVYFPFTQKRTTIEILNYFFSDQVEIGSLLPHFVAEYWYVFLIYIVLIFVMIKIHYRIKQQEQAVTINLSIKNASASLFIFLCFASLTVLGIRGGLDERPIVLLDANKYTQAKYVPILINTPFSFLKSSDLNQLEPLNFYSETQLKKIYTPIHEADTGTFKPMNVCVIILESFSKEFTKAGKLANSYTPFLDSLISQSIFFNNAIANVKTSINGIPAVLSSAPCFTHNHYLNSLYCNNKLQTLPNTLKEKGYYSVFFHGGTNGTLNFNSFADLAGYDKYFGRTEYNNDKDYDGQWGIWDEPFLQRTAKEMNQLKQPFFTSIFTLSSHNPYRVPDKYKGKFPKGPYEITESVGYADYALKQFFNTISKQPWFENTLFVITPDHTSVSDNAFFSNLVGQYSIPVLLYHKGIKPEQIEHTVQQIDIMPTILDYLNYDKPFYALGKSMVKESKQPSLFFLDANYGCIQDSFFYILSNYQFIEKYNFKNDSLLKNNLPLNKADEDLLNYCKAYIQTYTNDVINNKTHLYQTNTN